MALPDDVLAAVLRRLPPRGIAAPRCVCKEWRSLVDGRRLLRADLLPLSLAGILLNYDSTWFTQFLSRPTAAAAVSCRLDYTVPPPPAYIYVKDHCNGLLLLLREDGSSCPRPITIIIPYLQPWAVGCNENEYLVFDPTRSPNYELFMVPKVPYKLREEEECEWPPSTLILPVFSSKTGSWEERAFDREGDAAGTLPAMVGSTPFCDHQCGYWRGALYVCFSDCFVMRPQILVWFLNERYCGQTEWVLKHDMDISHILPNLNYDEQQRDGPWVLQHYNYRPFNFNYDDDDDEDDVELEPIVEEKFEKFEWDSDNDNVLEPGSMRENCYIYFLGFHPYKDIVFLGDEFDRVLAYNWSSSKLQDLGKVFTEFYIRLTTYRLHCSLKNKIHISPL
uniref:F-box domain-containing protein n=1 Tax=Oryza rufipogon TaxID=4529 RepID=A0A0E0Q532_ORYRU